MRIAVMEMLRAMDARVSVAPRVPEATWAQFGRHVVLLGEESQWEAVRRSAEGRLTLQEYPVDVRRSHLHVVVQKGRLFQQEHSNVPVLLDRGRFLLVEIDPDEAVRWSAADSPCYSVRPLQDGQIVFREVSREPLRRERQPKIEELLSRLSQVRLQANILRLAQFPTRLSSTPHFHDASAWAQSELEAIGYATQWQQFSVPGGQSRNLIATRPSNDGQSPSILVVVAHLDSINHQSAAASAPGADDNASGSAGLLELALALADAPPTRELRFLLVGGEEQGLLGSKRYVENLSVSEQRRVEAVVNMDMIGSPNTVALGVLLEGAAQAQTVIDGLAESAATYTSLEVQVSLEPFASDHVSFLQAAMPAVLTIEAADSANDAVHSAADTPDRVSPELALEILRMNAAFLAQRLEDAA